ncbi:MAG: hypothetical protein ACXWWQ_05470 [Candidatus Limnocylindria bacterium]
MNQHRFDALSFIFGSIFVVAGLLLLTGGLQGIQLQWVGPVVAVLLGLVILFAVRPRPTPLNESAAPDEA